MSGVTVHGSETASTHVCPHSLLWYFTVVANKVLKCRVDLGRAYEGLSRSYRSDTFRRYAQSYKIDMTYSS